MKRNQQGSIVVIVAIVALILGLIGVGILSYVSAYNFGNKIENQLKAVLEDNENVYAQGTQKVIEIAQVPAMYAADVSKVTKEAIQGRYGADGSKAVFQMLREQNPTLDPSMYAKIQTVMEEFRNKFEVSQRSMIEVKRSYNTALGSLWRGLWLGIAGYPKINLDDYKIVTTDKARDAFTSKRDKGIQLLPAPAPAQ